MMDGNTPRVSIGFPVFNGEKYLRQSLDSWLAQSYTDFNLLISDNASTDATAAICREYAARDPRIRYHRNASNVGAAANFNQAFTMMSGEYFKWAAYDDVYAPDFLARCVKALDQAPQSVILCTTQTCFINDVGEVVKSRGFASERTAPDASEEARVLGFTEVLRLRNEHVVEVIWGLMRTETLAQTRLFMPFHSGDVVLSAELGLLGEFWQLPGYSIRLRQHGADRPVRSRVEENRWWGLNQESFLKLPLPVKLFVDHLSVIRRANLSVGKKLWRYLQMSVYLECRLRKIIRTVVWKMHKKLTRTALSTARFTSLPARILAFVYFAKAGGGSLPKRLWRAFQVATSVPLNALNETLNASRQNRQKMIESLYYDANKS